MREYKDTGVLKGMAGFDENTRICEKQDNELYAERLRRRNRDRICPLPKRNRDIFFAEVASDDRNKAITRRYVMNQLDFLKEHVPCYIYDGKAVTAQCRKLKITFPDYDILYSIKANPFPDIIKAVAKEGLGADAASPGEVEFAMEYRMS